MQCKADSICVTVSSSLFCEASYCIWGMINLPFASFVDIQRHVSTDLSGTKLVEFRSCCNQSIFQNIVFCFEFRYTFIVIRLTLLHIMRADRHPNQYKAIDYNKTHFNASSFRSKENMESTARININAGSLIFAAAGLAGVANLDAAERQNCHRAMYLETWQCRKRFFLVDFQPINPLR